MADSDLQLRVLPPTGAPFQVDLEPELLVGRDEDCDLTLAHETVSANHALLTVKGTSVAIKDLDSTNGTIVGGDPVRGESWLRAGMPVEVGVFRLELVSARGKRATQTEKLPKQTVRLDERDSGVIKAVLAEWADPSIKAPAARGAEDIAKDLHCSRQEANRRVARLEAKLGLPKGERGAARYRRLAEELLNLGFTGQ